MTSIAEIEEILQSEQILEDFFYEDSLKGKAALIHEEENALVALSIQDEFLVLHISNYINDKELSIVLCETDDDIVDFLQDVPSAVLWAINNMSPSEGVEDLRKCLNSLEQQGLSAEEDYEPNFF